MAVIHEDDSIFQKLAAAGQIWPMSCSLPTPGIRHSIKKDDMGPVMPAWSCFQDVVSEKARCRAVSIMCFRLGLRWGGGEGDVS